MSTCTVEFLGFLGCSNKTLQTGGFKQQKLLTVQEARKSKIKVLANSISEESSLSSLQMAILLGLHTAFPCCMCLGGGGEYTLVSSYSYKDTNPSD